MEDFDRIGDILSGTSNEQAMQARLECRRLAIKYNRAIKKHDAYIKKRLEAEYRIARSIDLKSDEESIKKYKEKKNEKNN